MILKAIICIISVFLITYRIGLITTKITKRTEITEIFVLGIITLFAVLQVILLPSILLHLSFRIPYIATCIIISLLIISSFFIVKISEEKEIWKRKFLEIKKQNIKEIILNIIIICLILFQATLSGYLFRENADDSFYVSLATQSIDSDKLYMEDPSLGLEKEYTLFSSFEQISSYELGMAIIAKTFSISPSILFHSILPFILIVFSYMAYYYLINTLTKDRKKSKMFLLLVLIMFLFGGFSIKFRAGELLFRTWQGKSIFLNLGLTTLWALLLQFNQNSNKRLVFLIALCNIANVFLSSTAIFIVTFAYIGFGIIELIKKNWKKIVNLIISLIPIAISVLILVVLIKTTKLHTEIKFEEQNIKQLLLLYGSKKYLILYGISYIIIAFFGKKEEKTFFTIIPIINAITIWNPLFINIIAKYLTSAATFWRVLWLLPIELSIACSILLIMDKVKNKYKSVAFIIGIMIIIICGKFTYNKEIGFSTPENWEKIPQYIIDQTNYIIDNTEKDEKIMVMAPGEPLHSCTMRQLTPKIELLYSRMMYFDDILSYQEICERSELYNIYIYGVPQFSTEEFNQRLEKFNIDWIIISNQDSKLREYLDKTIMTEQTEIEGYILFKK